LGLVTGLVLAEVALRLYLRPYDETRFRRADPVYHHGLVPNARGRQRTSEWDVEYRVNSMGLRDREIPLAKAAGTYRIVWTGDSTIEGAGLSLEDTAPKQLERLLNSGSCRKRFEVLNAGVASFSPILEYLFMKTAGLHLAPDLVVQHFDMSDVQDDYFYSRVARFGAGDVPEATSGLVSGSDVGGLTLHGGAPRGFLERTVRATLLFQFVRNLPAVRELFGVSRMTLDTPRDLEARGLVGDIRVDRFAITRDGASAELSSHWRRSLRYLALTGELLRSHGVQWVLTVSPYGHQVAADESEPGRRYFGLGPGLYRSTTPFRTLEEFGATHRVTVINTLEAFREAEVTERPLFYRYDMHLNARGARVYARAVETRLRQSGALATAGC
jgi:hypothetical protein